MHQIRFQLGAWGSASDPAGGAYSAPPDPVARIKGPNSKGREELGREGRRREGRGREGRERKGRGRERRGRGCLFLLKSYATENGAVR